MKLKDHIFLLLLSAILLVSCSNKDKEHVFRLNGPWQLQMVTYPDGYKSEYPVDGKSWIRIYDDSCYYQCQLTSAPTGAMIAPTYMDEYTYNELGNNNNVYLQGDNTYPLTIENDSVITIQENGGKYTWKRSNIESNRCQDIIGIIRQDIENNNGEPYRYVFSKAEDELTIQNHALTYIVMFVIVALVIIVNYARNLHINKKRVEQELRLIQQEKQSMPEPVRKAMSDVEEEFHQSDFYLTLRKKINNGEGVSEEEWNEIDERFKSVYPRFTSTLLKLHDMSQVEYRVCMLLKLNITPSVIADVLYKDKSSISSIRRRLYTKVFDKKGTSKDWDEFINSL